MPDPTPTPELPTKPALLRVIGPAGAGKTYLITLLIEELRPLGHFVATAAPRAFNQASEVATVITISSGARVTVEKALPPHELTRLVASLAPRASLLLAESLDAPDLPYIEVLPGDEQSINAAAGVPLATVHTSELAPGALAPLAQLIAQRLLGAPTPEQPHGFLARLFRGKN